MSEQVVARVARERGEFQFQRAIVIGGGIAGLTVARVLADHVAQVTIVERDQRPDEPEERPGVPQAHHPHNLQPQAQRMLETLFPGLSGELRTKEAVTLERTEEVAVYYEGKWQPSRLDARRAFLSCSRALLEQALYKRIHVHPRIDVMYGYNTSGLTVHVQEGRVRGVRLLPRNGSRQREQLLDGDLVVDASGRRSRAPEWLAEVGYQPPEEWHVDAQVGYASRVYRRPAEPDWEWKMLYVRPTPPDGTRGGIILPLEGNRWHVSLIGVAADYPPTDEDGFMTYASSLPTPVLHEAIRSAEPLSRIYGFRRADNRVRRYDRLPRLLEGFLVSGDAAYALNPLYAQGMTAAVLSADALLKVLAEQAERGSCGVWGLAHAYQQQVSEAVGGPWRLATRTDWSWPETEVRDNVDNLETEVF